LGKAKAGIGKIVLNLVWKVLWSRKGREIRVKLKEMMKKGDWVNFIFWL
jgi:hypothetical protein